MNHGFRKVNAPKHERRVVVALEWVGNDAMRINISHCEVRQSYSTPSPQFKIFNITI